MIIWESCLASWKLTILPLWCMNRSNVRTTLSHYNFMILLMNVLKSDFILWIWIFYFWNYYDHFFFQCCFHQTWQTALQVWSRWCLGWWQPSTCSILSLAEKGENDRCQNPPMSWTKTGMNMAKIGKKLLFPTLIPKPFVLCMQIFGNNHPKKSELKSV